MPTGQCAQWEYHRFPRWARYIVGKGFSPRNIPARPHLGPFVFQFPYKKYRSLTRGLLIQQPASNMLKGLGGMPAEVPSSGPQRGAADRSANWRANPRAICCHSQHHSRDWQAWYESQAGLPLPFLLELDRLRCRTEEFVASGLRLDWLNPVAPFKRACGTARCG